MLSLFNTLIYQPLLQLLIFIYQNLAFQDLGLAIILFTIAIRLILFPLFQKSAVHQATIQKIQPRIQKIQKELKGDKEKQTRELMNVYREHNINPFFGLLLLIIQLPIIIGLYRVILIEISRFDNFMFLGLINLREKNLILAVIAAILQYYQSKLALAPKSSDKKDPQNMMGNMMVILGPALSLAILSTLPSALGLYWVISTAFSLGQQVIVNKKIIIPETKNGTSN